MDYGFYTVITNHPMGMEVHPLVYTSWEEAIGYCASVDVMAWVQFNPDGGIVICTADRCGIGQELFYGKVDSGEALHFVPLKAKGGIFPGNVPPIYDPLSFRKLR